ncbi:GerAB/ArcD/ProY family transporter [Tepidibacter formicigenes]|jgi:spore germination protein KB|uniref:Spore germination protein KB n=1 Tax=Tepidibacter formicigenes DSM 15518 TaxID=1123349 RepID=A0A1M6JRF1_9FIRM|nr:endospore germination permease [Tepidibacter formicigenes]SHJ49254.1 spore germination protein KB [Tepidibacter formicigenes DSM 15518]
MNEEILSDKQGLSIMIMFIIGTASIMARGLDAKQDLWIAIILAMIAHIPIALVCSYLLSTFPGKNIFDIIELCFGNIIGKVVLILYTLFIFHTGVLVYMNFTNFVNTVALWNTPKIIVMIIIVILSSYIVKEGIEVIGRWAEVFLIILIGFILISRLLLIKDMNIDNLYPFLNNGIKPIIKGTYSVFAFPFTQTAVFTAAFSRFKTKKSYYNVYLKSLLIGGLVIFIISVTNILVLGVNRAVSVYYASYDSTSRIDVGSLLQRLEVIIAVVFSFGAFIKGSIYLLASCKGISRIFDINDYKFIVIPISLLMINLSYFLHDGVKDYFEWILNVWQYYAFPFQVILPIIVFITVEIRYKNLIKNIKKS